MISPHPTCYCYSSDENALRARDIRSEVLSVSNCWSHEESKPHHDDAVCL
jgi:hypothetical protein